MRVWTVLLVCLRIGGTHSTRGEYLLKHARRNADFSIRHLGGAHQDNRVVPFEGCPISAFTPEQREEIYAIIQAFNIYLPEGPMKYKMQRIRKFEDQTYFAWIGKFGLGDPYYFRIHSPATFCEVSFPLLFHS